MKSIFLFFSLFLLVQITFGQEICDNAIDDDGDGFVDLYDDECICEGFGEEILSLIPNPSFEEMDCCPTFHSQMTCASTWIQASDATSDYYNTCGYTAIMGEGVTAADITDIPDGEAWVGYWTGEGYLEYIGACLDAPLIAGVEYTLNFHTAWGRGNADHDFTIYATPSCGDLPWSGIACPIGVGSWELLTSETITYPMDGTWQEITITFTPTSDMYAIAFGGVCSGESPMRYTYIDGLTLIDSDSYSSISETGSWCDGDLMLEATTDTSGGAWQWYLEGVALIGETSETIDVNLYGMGEYNVLYAVGDICIKSNYTILSGEDISANFEFTTVCVGFETAFTNTSIYDGIDPEWQWDFGDGFTSSDENPNHTYAASGAYTVELIALNDLGCQDTIEIELTVNPSPVADFEFVINGVSSEDGATTSCIENEIQFNDLSTIIEPSAIISWNWDFGDGSSSLVENPSHIYSTFGTFTITLTVTSDLGCVDNHTLVIVITESLEMSILSNEPTCNGFSDGSVTINIIGGVGDLLFEISDSEGNIINEDNSNTANTLSSGWYYFHVTDGSTCEGVDSIYLDQPEEISIDLTPFNVLCAGDETGWIKVDSVYHTTGDYSNISYLWNPNPAGIGGIDADSSFNMGAGNYTLTINDENGCSKVFDLEIIEPSPLSFSEYGYNPAYCRIFDYQSGNGVVYGAAIGGKPDYDYLWTNSDNGETSINSTWGGLNPGNYELLVIDANGCVLEQSLVLDSLNPIAAFTINSDQLNSDHQGTAPAEVSFINESENFADSTYPDVDTVFFWNLDHPTADWQISTDYFESIDTTYLARGNTYTVDVCLVAINKNGCTDTTCKLITIYEPIVFNNVNIFSPNGDGINDGFTFDFKSASIDQFSCMIVNRWGVIVGELNNIHDVWLGTDKNGNPCSDGVYFYTYQATSDNDTNFEGQGTVQIIGSK